MPFRALIAYADIPAARRAMSEIRDVLAATRRGYELHPMLWRFDQLGAPSWREVALRDAANAAVVVLAGSEPGSLPASLERWVSTLLSRKEGRPTTIVAVLGATDAWTITIEKPATAAAALTQSRAAEPKALPHVVMEASAACAA